jgi:16S rRNA (uracil1498-N3)-methyltransferase
VVRIWVTGDLEAGERITASAEQAHYLLNVMRLSVGDETVLFNGRDGEWLARIVEAPKRGCVLGVEALTRPQVTGPDLELIATLVKRAALETIVEKAVELGAARIRLAVTEYANRDHARVDRLRAIAVEAAEQTGRLDAPAIAGPEPLADILSSWTPDRALMFCDEAGDAPSALRALKGRQSGAWAVLIGPEGGFSPAERAAIRALPAAVPVTLGPRILRADTAAVCALTLWQAALGDLKAS